MLALRSIAQFATFVALINCRSEDRPPRVAPGDSNNPTAESGARIPTPDLNPRARMDPGSSTGPIATIGGEGAFGGAGGAGGMGGSGGSAAAFPEYAPTQSPQPAPSPQFPQPIR
ncbi:MAG TPA: hypothetical protein VL137_04245 [Polyangiaceae bacterium]|nr:hypothetical protein [Polyangiaceae bacterium]